MTLVQAFAQSWHGAIDDEASLEGALGTFLERSRASDVDVTVDDVAFVAHIAERLDVAQAPVDALPELRAADLRIAFGCLQRDAKAIAWFRDSIMNVIRAVVANSDPSAADDVYQSLFCRLFLPSDDTPPRIQAYDGRRELGPWIRTLARNAAIDQLRRTRPMSPLEQEHVERVGEMLDDQETSYLRESCWADFKAALADAFAQLEPRQRNVLRCHLRGLTAEQIGRMYRVHRVTVARWLAAIRFALLESTREGLRQRLAGDERSVDSVVRMVELDLTASLTRLVEATDPDGDEHGPP